MMSNNSSSTLSGLISFLPVCWFLLTCGAANTFDDGSKGNALSANGALIEQRRIARKIDPLTIGPDDWKPIDYGHPMRNDPTLVYVPPVVDPVHYGIHSAEPLWPVRGHQLPPFQLPVDGIMTSASSADHYWTRLRPVFRPAGADGPPFITANQHRQLQSQQARTQQVRKMPQHRRADDIRSLQWSTPMHSSRKEQLRRYPIKSVASTAHRDRQMIGLLPTHQAMTAQRGLPYVASPIVAIERPSDNSITPLQKQLTLIGATSSLTFPSFSDRITADVSNNREELTDPGSMPEQGMHPSADGRSSNKSLTEAGLQKSKDQDTIPPKGKRARGSIFPFTFFIQQGHSRVRTYGTQ